MNCQQLSSELKIKIDILHKLGISGLNKEQIVKVLKDCESSPFDLFENTDLMTTLLTIAGCGTFGGQTNS